MSKKSQERYRSVGLCILCGEVPPRSERDTCEKCAKRCSENTKRSREHRIGSGKCCVCGVNDLVTKRHCEACRVKHHESAREAYQLLRQEVYDAYGGFVCACCGEPEPAFLSIDHINNDGCQHRKEIGSRIYKWLKDNNFPSGFQVLCMNCQWGRKNCGICPHQLRKVKTMKIVEFYRGERANNAGHTLEEILTWSNGALEMDHDWVQWVFGSNERSMLNGDAPTMTKEESQIFEADPELQEKVKQSLVRFLQFLDFSLMEDEERVIIEPKDDNIPWWIRGSFNHNMLRVTRVLKCLRLTGNTRYAVAFFDALREFKDKLSTNTWNYYHDAVFNNLWPQVVNL